MCEMNTLASQQMAVNSSRQSMSLAFKNHLSEGTLNCLQFCSNDSRGASAKWFKDKRQLYCKPLSAPSTVPLGLCITSVGTSWAPVTCCFVMAEICLFTYSFTKHSSFSQWRKRGCVNYILNIQNYSVSLFHMLLL